MATVHFSNGTSVNFNGTPSQQDIDEVAAKISQSGQPMQDAQGPQLKDTGSFLGNLGNSIGNFASGIGQAVSHPIQTVENIAKPVLGGVQELAGGSLGTGNEQSFNNLIDYYKQRYGSVDNFLKTAYQDPVGTAADASLLLGGVGGLVSKVGDITDAAKLSQVGKTISSVGEAVNPVSVATKPLGMAATGTANVLQSMSKSLLDPELDFSKAATTTKLTAENASAAKEFIFDNAPEGTKAEKLNWANQTTRTLTDVRDNALTNELSDITVPTSEVKAYLNDAVYHPDIFGDANNEAFFKGFQKQAASIDRFGDNITLNQLNDLKVSAGKAGHGIGDNVTNAVNTAIGKVYQAIIENTLDANTAKINIPPELQDLFGGKTAVPIKEYNSVFKRAVDAKNLLAKSVEKKHPLINQLNKGVLGATGLVAGHGILGKIAEGYIGEKAGEFLNTKTGRTIEGNALKGASKVARAGAKIPRVAVPAAVLSRISSATARTQ